MQTIGIVFERSGLARPDQQRPRLGQVDVVRSFRVATREDAGSALASVLEDLQPGDGIAVASLAVLALGERPLTSVLADLAARGIQVAAAAEGVDSRRDAGFLPAAVQIEAGVQAARRADAAAVIARASQRPAQTPPKAEFIPAEFSDLL